ncbi:flavin monoamine oxidase family protein [Roseicyclus persicicus]|uniref:Tryptophan 2-monooxygenase n=1 Tax=Roseicyclus persicicus TaxID=2650661 RepID=A0A7X6JVD8_9RHOB|nr:FAD-dependent oxidoreductase [Roseibacterium persicicum]NKX43227.1 FAD-dependent oxidoreductase [Roseibacterium persicicum]
MRGRRRFLGLTGAALAAPALLRAEGHVDAEVVVIGAGAAGIAAARQLLEWEYEVVVLEARARVGGRAWTDGGALGLAWDRGAQWLHNGGANPLRAEARALDLTLTDSVFEDMQVTRGAEGEVDEDAAEALLAALGRLDARTDAAEAAAGPGATLAALATGAPFEDAALALSALSMGGDPARVSLIDAATLASGEDALVEGGTGGLLQALARDLPVRTGHAVTRIDLRPADHVAVSGGFGTLRAGVVLVTVPPMVLARGGLRVTPELPDWKQAALSALGPAEFLKVGLRLEAPAPEEAEFAVDLDAVLAGRGALLHLDPRAPLASVLFAGAHASALSAEGPRAVAAAARAVLDHHTGLAAVAVDHHDWAADALSLGPWARVRPGADSAREDYAAAVDGRLFFAGEAAPGRLATTLGGAWAAGIAAAGEIWEAT